LELAGVSKPTEWEGERIPVPPGRSLAPAFAEDVVIARKQLWWMHEGHRAIRVGDWKLVAAKGDPWELYDLSVDRAESNNLATRMPEKVKQLEAAWERQLNAMSELAAKTKGLGGIRRQK
jgi:arylsulfatase